MNSDSDSELVSALERVEETYIQKNTIEEYKVFLRRTFGFNEFRDYQLTIIDSIISQKRDNFVIMATGHGKSLCYQFPSMWTRGLTIVVCPLISLMRDQVNSLNNHKIAATFLGSAQPDSTRIREELINTNCFRIVYMTPEYVTRNYSLIRKLAGKLTLIAIDEAHCVSHWGNDFRKDYQKLGELRKIIPNVPIVALTATATECVKREIVVNLCLRNPQFTCTGFDRPNIELLFEPLEQFPICIRKLAKTVDGSIIVYCPSKSDCEDIAFSLKKDNIDCEYYHADVDNSKRSHIELNFRKDKIKIIISTCAFGMGIDKPDVRYVIHYRAVKSIEQYYQEIGRAGRDGKPSKSIVFFERTDVAKYLETMQNEKTLANASPYSRRKRILLGSYFEQFLISDRCRRLQILQYFEGLSVTCQPHPGCCDNCNSGKSKKYSYKYRNMDEKGLFDFTFDVRILMKLINTIPIGILRSKIKPQQQISLKNHDESYWNGLIDVLERLMYIKTVYAEIPSLPMTRRPEVVKLDRLGLDWISTNEPLKFQLQPFDKLTRYVEVRVQDSPQPSVFETSTDKATKTNELRSMVLLLKEHPYPRQVKVHDITNHHREVMDLISKKLSIPQIERRLSFSRSTVTGCVSTLLQQGYPIKKKDLERLYGLFENVFQSILLKLPLNIFRKDVIRSVRSELPGVSCDQIRLVQCYRYPRVYLKNLHLNFDDPDELPYAATQFVPSTVHNIQDGMNSLIPMCFGEGNSYHPSEEITQENLSDCNDDQLLDWDDSLSSPPEYEDKDTDYSQHTSSTSIIIEDEINLNHTSSKAESSEDMKSSDESDSEASLQSTDSSEASLQSTDSSEDSLQSTDSSQASSGSTDSSEASLQSTDSSEDSFQSTDSSEDENDLFFSRKRKKVAIDESEEEGTEYSLMSESSDESVSGFVQALIIPLKRKRTSKDEIIIRRNPKRLSKRITKSFSNLVDYI